MKIPCADCPWRKDAPIQWSADRFQNLALTCRDDGASIMACHKSREGNDLPCVGFVVQVADESIGLRIAAATGRIDLREYEDGGHELFGSFEEMLAATKAEVPPRNNHEGRRKMAKRGEKSLKMRRWLVYATEGMLRGLGKMVGQGESACAREEA